MELSSQLSGDLLTSGYHSFDRIVIERLSERPVTGGPFVRHVLRVPVASKEVFRQHMDDYATGCRPKRAIIKSRSSGQTGICKARAHRYSGREFTQSNGGHTFADYSHSEKILARRAAAGHTSG
jgi:hypothetical protein